MSFPFRATSVLVLAAVLAVVGAPNSPVLADELVPPGSTELESAGSAPPIIGTLGETVLDPATHRAFVLNTQYDMIEVIDTSYPDLVPITRIPTPVVANNIAIDPGRHRVYTSDYATSTVAVIDVDPASSTANTTVQTIPTGGAGSTLIAVDPVANVLFVSNLNSKDVSIINLADGSHQLAATGVLMTDLVADPDRHQAVLSSSDAGTLTKVQLDGTFTVSRTDWRPGQLAIARGQLLVTFTEPSSFIERFDLTTGEETSRSRGLAAQAVEIAVDDALQLIYVIHAAGGAPAIEVLEESSLAVQATPRVDVGYFHHIAVDPGTHQLYLTRTYSAESHVDRYRIHQSPLPSVDRIGGADRFAVAAAASAGMFTSGAPVAYVATSAVFADALSGSAAAGHGGGPVLLVSKDNVPAATAAELTRLRPRNIVILGGAASISAAVERTLGSYSPTVSRIGGADRYEVSAAVSAATFDPGVKHVYLASGEVFPDALSASPAAGREGSSVLLVQKSSVPASVSQEIDRLDPEVVIILGGENTISESVVQALVQKRPVLRIGGSDRFDVAAQASAGAFRHGTHTVYVASGEVFPDALAGAAVAIADTAPVLLVSHDSVPAAAAAELERLRPYRIVVLGGQNTISDHVLDLLNGYLPK
jgi:putative cell wall-binding protein/DNA-binding beta-propeller fold protein YncE